MSAWHEENVESVIVSIDALTNAVKDLDETLVEILVELRNIAGEIKHHD